MNISHHRWPPEPRGGQHVTRTETGIIAIDDESGYAVACISERSQAANARLATQRLNTIIDHVSQVAQLNARLESCERTIDECDKLEAIHQNKLRDFRELLEQSRRDLIREGENSEKYHKMFDDMSADRNAWKKAYFDLLDSTTSKSGIK